MISVINNTTYSEVDCPELRTLNQNISAMKANKSCSAACKNMFNSLVYFLNAFVTYADNELKGKEYEKELMIPQLFMVFEDLNDAPVEYWRYSLYVARVYVKKLLDTELDVNNAEGYDFLALQLGTDLELLVCFFENKCKKRNPKMVCNSWSSMKLSARDMAFAMNEMFYIDSIPTEKICKREIKAASTFVIRQLLETLGKGIIGYSDIKNKNNEPSKKHTQVAWKF